MDVHVLRLEPGSDLRPALEAAMRELAATRGVQAACIVSGVGSLGQAVLRFAEQPEGTTIAGPLELVTLAGTLSVDGAHLHACVGDAQGQLRAGHVMPGCIVRTTAELVIGLLPGWEFSRAPDAATGFRELVAKPLARPDYDYP